MADPRVFVFDNVQDNHEIVAEFEAEAVVQFTIVASVNGTGGVIDPSGAVVVNQGASQSFTVTPDAGMKIKRLVVDGVEV